MKLKKGSDICTEISLLSSRWFFSLIYLISGAVTSGHVTALSLLLDACEICNAKEPIVVIFAMVLIAVCKTGSQLTNFFFR